MEDNFLQSIQTYFVKKIQTFGPTPQGVDWNTEEAQQIRFKQLIKILPVEQEAFKLIDFGCGYGAFLRYLRDRGNACQYIGYDCVSEMIEQAMLVHKQDDKAKFICGQKLTMLCDYSVASGVFNQKDSYSDKDWAEYVVESLDMLNQFSQKGFAANFLTSYSDADKRREDLYYADPCFYFDLCKQRFSKNVALLHDYGAYEFTLLVRKETA